MPGISQTKRNQNDRMAGARAAKVLRQKSIHSKSRNRNKPLNKLVSLSGECSGSITGVSVVGGGEVDHGGGEEDSTQRGDVTSDDNKGKPFKPRLTFKLTSVFII